MKNRTQYFGDLLYLSPSFSLEEKKKIFQKYISSDELLSEWIQIFEEELEKITHEYIALESRKLEAIENFLIGFDTTKTENEKRQKIAEILKKNRLAEESEKAKEIFNSEIIF